MYRRLFCPVITFNLIIYLRETLYEGCVIKDNPCVWILNSNSQFNSSAYFTHAGSDRTVHSGRSSKVYKSIVVFTCAGHR
jgi:hypothetical protein